MSFPTIQIFACDHRKNVQWDLPYIRLGCSQSDASVNTKIDDSLEPYQVVLSEGSQIWWIYKHLAEFGNPQNIGFCHYRRFFGNVARLIEDHSSQEHDFAKKAILPHDQLALMLNNNLDGLVPTAICPLQKTQQYNYSNIIEQTKMISDHDGLGFTTEIVNKAFSFLIDSFPDSLVDYAKNAMLNQHIYVCNIFTMKTKLFMQYCSIVFNAVEKLYAFSQTIDTSKFHKRWMGYILERYTSVVLQSFQLAKLAKFGVVPLLTIDGWKHEPFEKHVGK